MRYAAFHGYSAIVRRLLDAGAIPGLRNDEAESALALAKAGIKMLTKPPRKGPPIPCADRPRTGDPAALGEVIRLLEVAEKTQWVIVGVTERPYLNGRIGKRVRVMGDGRVMVVVDDSASGPHRPYFEKAAVRTALLLPSQLRRLRPPPPPMKEWPADRHWAWPEEQPGEPAVMALADGMARTPSRDTSPAEADASILAHPTPAASTNGTEAAGAALGKQRVGSK